MQVAGKNEVSGGAVLFFSILLTVLLLLLFCFHHFGVPAGDFFTFVLGLVVIVYIPGRALCRLAGLKARRLESTALCLVLGMVSSTLVYKFSRILGFKWLFLGWLLASAFYFLYNLVRHPPRRQDFSFRVTWVGVGLVGIFILVLATLWVDNYRNGILDREGSLTVNMHYYDGFLRNAVIGELSHSVPPEMPFAAGKPLSYHYGMDLFIALFHRELGLGVLDLNHRLMLTFFFGLLVLCLFSFIQELSLSAKTALLGTFLVIFGSGGLLYVASIILGTPQGGNVFYSFYFFDFLSVNSFLPALSILSAGFFCLVRYVRAKGLGWLLSASALFALSAEFKIFFVGPVVAALCFAGVVALLRSKDSALLRAGALTAALSLPLLLAAYLGNQDGPQFSFQLKGMDWIAHTLSEMKLVFLGKHWEGLLHLSRFSLEGVLLFLPSLLLFFLGSFGVSILALPSAVKGVFSWPKDHQIRFFFITLFGGSVFYFFFFFISLGQLPRNIINIYVYYLGLVILMVFFSERAVQFSSRQRKLSRVILVSLVILLCVPNTVRFLDLKIRYPHPLVFSPTYLEACRWVSEHTPPRSVVIQPLNLRYVPYLAARRVVLDNSVQSYLHFHLTAAEIAERKRDVARFFRDPELNGDVLEKYSVSYVWAIAGLGILGNENSKSLSMRCYTDMGTEKIRKFQQSSVLEPVFRNSDCILYRVASIPTEKRQFYFLEEVNGQRFLRQFGSTPEE